MSKIKAGTTSTTAYQVEADTTGTLVLQTGATPTTAMTIDSSQNIGIGTSSPAAKLDVSGQIRGTGVSPNPTNGVNTFAHYGSGSFGGGYGLLDGTNAWGIYAQSGNFVVSSSASGGGSGALTSRVSIDTSGNLLVKYTAKGSTTVTGHVAANAYACKAGADAALGGNVFNINWTGSAQIWIDGTNIGTVTVTSDYRIKQKVETQITPALERVMQLRPVTYELKDYGMLYKADGVVREGFIAHELQAVIPSAVEGAKDAEDQIQSLKLDALCSVLTKAIQELKSELDAAKADIATLKGA